MMAQLTVLNGPLRGAGFPLPKSGALFLGQCLYNDIQLSDRSAAPYHCVFVRGTEQDEDQYIVIDLHTEEGTRVNDVRINKAALHNGTEIAVGDTKLRFEAQPGGKSGPVPVPPDGAIALLDAQKRQQRRARMALASSPTARARIQCRRGAMAGEEVSVDPTLPLYFGRTRGADVMLTDPGASRHQCLIVYEPTATGFILYDLHTTNGTVLNGEAITLAPLHDGDTIEVGTEAQLVFCEAATEDESQDLDETRELTHATMVLPRAKKTRSRKSRSHRHRRGLQPEPVFQKDDTSIEAPAAAHSAEEKEEVSPSEQPAKRSGRRDKETKSGVTGERMPLAGVTRPSCLFSEAYRSLRTNLDLTTVDGTGRCIIVTSPGPQEGKTCVAVNVAIAAAGVGLKVLLLEGDLRRSRLHRVFVVKARPGLVNYLANGDEINGHIRRTHIENLYVLPRGSRPANPTELLHSEVLADLLDRLREEFDLIVIDTPPMLTVADAAVLSNLADGYLLVLRAGKTPRQAAIEAVKQIEHVHGKVLGVVLNDVNPKERGYRYYHHYQSY